MSFKRQAILVIHQEVDQISISKVPQPGSEDNQNQDWAQTPLEHDFISLAAGRGVLDRTY